MASASSISPKGMKLIAVGNAHGRDVRRSTTLKGSLYMVTATPSGSGNGSTLTGGVATGY